MFLKKAKPVICAVCGKPIAPKESRFVEKNRLTKAERYSHVSCRKAVS